ncbi:hypothetical protein PAPYR_3326 [Paratrimastix pyriformis]|uniref:Beta-mannosidase Ig-fold domain-containing protein n=1 Tax=Paratrimastix pyriformis TaxID=342808 RepID=A0ABQ8UMB9_9EUKA|nr:hypothetical protein PAPYR_3326 [Paratrimastix pyriformis]
MPLHIFIRVFLRPQFAVTDVSLVEPTRANVTFVAHGSGLQPLVFLEAGSSRSGGVDGYFSDNYLLVMAEIPITLQFQGWGPLDACALGRSIKFYSLLDACSGH